jgi:hypothetical protein
MHYPEIIETIGGYIDIAGVLLLIVGLLIAIARYLRAFGRVTATSSSDRKSAGPFCSG